MTYCVGLRLNAGLVFMSDTRTNAGVDNFSKTKKMFTWAVPGERFITLMTAGNLATTQSLVSLLDERSKAPKHRSPTILKQPTMFEVARLVGATLKEVIGESNASAKDETSKFRASLILGGQIKGGASTMFFIYPEGNFVEVTDETPFFQIGEAKYGKPIIIRVFDQKMSFNDSVKLLMVSFDSTIKSNLSVGLPIDIQTYEADSFKIGHQVRLDEDDEYYQSISSGWGNALKQAFETLPSFKF